MKALTDIAARPLKGGCITSQYKALLPFGAFSYLQNIRNTNPGLEQRMGQRRLHTTPDGTNQVLTMFNFSKTNVAEKHFLAQMSDGDILEATNAPPTVTSGPFGAEVFSGALNQIPASWGVIEDILLMSNGKDPHQIYGGTSSTVERFFVFKGTAAIPTVPQGGEDYSDWVQDANDGFAAILDSLDTYANYHCVFVRTPVPAKSLTLTVSLPNGNTSDLSIYYWKSDSTWAQVSDLVDGTSSSGKTLAQTGTITFTQPTDMIPKYAFGSCGFWYQIRVSAALDSEVEISKATFSSGWNALENVWDGQSVYSVEAQLEATTGFETYAGGSVEMSELAAGKKVYLAFSDPVEGIYADPGGTPNTVSGSLSSVKYWDGNSWVSVGTFTDGSENLTHVGWITFPRCPAHPHQFHTSIYQAYWYELTWSADISADTVVSYQGMPFFNIQEIGNGGTNAIWKDRACYSFDRYGAYIYVTGKNAPYRLNGVDFGILKAGDGRSNKIVGMRKFHNELMVWQQELGEPGGCITLFEGYSPQTFGKLVLSSKIGSMNAKSMCVVDGVMTSTKTEETIKTVAFSLSRYGVCAIDGVTVSIISDDIGNYFDPTQPECIRHGYENEMWLEHDPVYNVIRVGLVSGATATKCNVFPVMDLVTKTWSFDTPAQNLSCICVAEPDSGQAPVVVVGGGADDGYIYETNYGDNDVATAVTAIIEMVLNSRARVLNLYEMLFRFAAQPSGSASISVFLGESFLFAKQLSLAAEKAGDESRRHRVSCNATGDMMILRITNASRGETLNLHEVGLGVNIWEKR